MEGLDGYLFTKLIRSNIDGLAAFVEQLLAFDGKVNFRYLHRVRESGGGIEVAMCSDADKNNDYAIVIGGEVPNSFSPLYEAAYFLEALFLSAFGTLYLGKYGASRGSGEEVRRNISAITGEEMLEAAKAPSINIISSLDTDIEPYRYVKHQLWRLGESAFKKRCSDVTSAEFGEEPVDESLRGTYWVERDREIAETAMKYAKKLPEAKAIQYYLVIKELLSGLGVDAANVPLYFNFVPKEEVLMLGPDNEFLQSVAALHDPKFRKVLSRITRTSHPWIVSMSCPNCGESSKKVIRATLSADAKNVHLFCSGRAHEFRNELGTKVVARGCGHSWSMAAPTTSMELYELFREKSPTINFAVRYLLAVIKTTVDCPVCWPVTELGIERKGDGYTMMRDSPKGYGDHLNLLTSLLAVQHLFVRGMIASEFAGSLIKRGVVTSREMQILSWAGEAKLSDPDVVCGDDRSLHVTDTSVLKALANGLSCRELFERSINLNALGVEQLLEVQKRSLAELMA